ncbi:MAG: small ribosomal subunit Rsm22 family protein, partial [Myxococcaceae bacterium]
MNRINLEYQAFLHAKSIHASDLIPDIKALWKALTQERADSLSDYFRKPALRRAYLGYYMPLYAMKIASLLESLNLPFKNPKVLDLGAGPLSGTFGAHLAFGGLSQSVAVDREIGPMRAGVEFFEGLLKKKLDIKLVQANLKGPSYFWKPDFKPDIIIMAHVLNEFGSGSRYLESKHLLISQAMKLLDKNGVLVVIEPASKVASRDIMAIRNWLHEEGQVKIIAPCPETDRCPLLLSRNNWCHAEFPHMRPKELMAVDQKIGFDREFLKCSYLVLAKPESPYQHKDFRIVSGLMNADGVLRRYACTSDGLLTLSQ